MWEKPKRRKGLILVGIMLACLAAAVLVPTFAYRGYNDAHPKALDVLHMDGVIGNIWMIRPNNQDYRTVSASRRTPLWDSLSDFRVTPCEDTSEDIYLSLWFHRTTSTGETEEVTVIMRSPTRYYVLGDSCEYEAYSDNPHWMALWEQAD